MPKAFMATGDADKIKALCPKNFRKRLFRKPLQLPHAWAVTDDGWGFEENTCRHCGEKVTVFCLP